MLRVIIKRVLWMIPLLWGVSIIGFSLSHLSPGSAGDLLLRQSGGVVSSESALKFKKELGLDKPLPVQYLQWLKKVALFDFGESFSTGESVRAEIMKRLPYTMKLSLTAFLLMIVMSLGAGIPAALNQGGLFDKLGHACSIILLAVPNYWLAMLMLYFFGVHWNILSVVGNSSGWQILFPAFALSIGMSAVYSRIVRERFLEVLNQDYIRTAYAKGLSLPVILFRHVFRNAIMPLVSLWGMSLGYMLGGSLLIETIFSWPGVASFAVQAVLNRDYPVTQCYVLLMAFIFSFTNLAVDILQILSDPELRRNTRKAVH